MGWLSSYGSDYRRALSFAPRRPTMGYQTFTKRAKSYGVDTRTSRAGSASFGDISSGRLAPRGNQPRPTAGFPERADFKYPFSTTRPGSPYAPPSPAAPASTQGDFMGSIIGSAGSVAANLNLANAIPWFMERVNVAANDLAASQVPVVSQVASGVDLATDAFIDVVEAASQPVGQVLDALPSWVRDNQLNDRAKLYRSIANGEAPDYGIGGPVSNPLAIAGQIAGFLSNPGGATAAAVTGGSHNLLAGVAGETVSEQARMASYWQKELLHAVDPQRKLDAEQRMAILRDSVDLPESVKQQIERKPGASDDEIGKWLDEMPEGKQWSYDPGISGAVQNFGNPMLFYIAEARAMGLAGRGLANLGREAGGAVGATIGAGARGAAVTQRLLTAATATGVAVTGINATMGAIARFAGNDAAVEWFDNANRTTPFSDDPMVQLATGFGINPISAAKDLKAGTVKLKHGLVDVPVNAVLGTKMQRYYDSATVRDDMFMRMFKLGSREEAAQFIRDEELVGQAHDMVMATALDEVLDSLPKEARLELNATFPDPVERAATVLQQFGQQALDLIAKDPARVAARFYNHDWQYRMSTLPFNAQAAAKIARDYRRAIERTYDIRAEQRAVVGYREYLPPQGQSLARSALDAATVDGMVPIRALTDLVVDLPVLAKHFKGRIKGTDEALPRQVVDDILADAAADWAHAAKVNPIRVATGSDPVIRPSSPTLTRDYAESMGTSVDTVNAISDFDPKSAAHADLLRRFLVDKDVVDDVTAAGLTPEEAFTRAAIYFDDTTSPWLETGRRLEAADVQVSRLKEDLARVRAENKADPHGERYADRERRLEREIREIEELVRTAGDPIRPFTQVSRDVVPLTDMHLVELAARKVDALERLRVVQSIDDELKTASLTEKDLVRVVTDADGNVVDALDMAAPPSDVLDAFIAFRTANMYVTKSVKGELTRRRQSERVLSNRGAEFIRYTEEAPGSYQWAQVADSPSFVKKMRDLGDQPYPHSNALTGNQIADIVEAKGLTRGMTGQSIDEIAATWGVTRDEAMTRLAGLKAAREAALDGKGAAALKRTAAIKVPDDYVVQAEANVAARALVYDAEYEAFWHPRNIAKVDEIASKPDELWPALRQVADDDPQVMEAIERVAASTEPRVPDSPPARFAVDVDRLDEAGIDAAIDAGATGGAKADHFGYHLTTPDAIDSIRKTGLEPRTTGDYLYGDEGVYFGASGGDIDRLIPRTHTGDMVLLRTSSEFLDAPYRSGELIASETVPPWALEFYGADGRWHPLVPGAPALKPWDFASRKYVPEDREWVLKMAIDDDLSRPVIPQRGPAPEIVPPGSTTTVERVFADPSYAAAVRKEVVPEGFEAPVEGMIRVETDLDRLLMSSDAEGIAALADQLAAAREAPRAAARVSRRAAQQMPGLAKSRRSYQYRKVLAEADARFTESPSEGIMGKAENRVGLEVLSVMNHGVTGTKPATLRGVIGLLEEIENGNAARLGIGKELQAEAQRVARALLDDAVRNAKRDPDMVGTLGYGLHYADEAAVARSIDDLLSFDQADPMGTLQYGLKKAPKDAVVMEWSRIPGLAEEMMSKRFLPYEERAFTTKTREAFNWVFGPRSNPTVRLETKARFIDRAARLGISPQVSDAAWRYWAKMSHDSRSPSLRKTAAGVRHYEAGDNPLYADVWNLPNDKLDSAVHGDHTTRGVIGSLADGVDPVTGQALDWRLSVEEKALADQINFADIFREASSVTRRTLADKVPLGEALAASYGKVAHNKAATTLYYWFRFGLDVRYHAMNYLEAQILYLGRAGLKGGEIDEGMLGMSEGYLRKLDLDPTSNTGYQFSRDRMAWAYRTFLKEQPDALRKGMRTVAKDDPGLMDQAMRELARFDPQLRDMVEQLDGTPDPTKYLKELDAWHTKMLNNIDEASDAKTIDEALAKEMADTPALRELYDQLAVANKTLWSDIRATFYGNPNRSRAERMLNSYLLFWPLSYQIKSTKWFAKVLFDKVGGVQTNALGAVTLDRMAETHNRLLATDPEYRDWYERHDTLVFVAQMMFPVSLESTGVSLNPFLRGLLFERDPLRAMEIGPVYTYNKVIRPIQEELSVDLYPTLKDYMGEREAPRGLQSP